MSIVSFKLHGDWSKTEKFLKAMEKADFSSVAERYGQIGVDALSRATPVDTGKTASSWGYVIEKSNDSFTINWINSNVNDGVNIAIILQYGHGTRNGGYVQGRDYINPAIRPIFDEMSDELWKMVTSA
jgi:hypothetical protein